MGHITTVDFTIVDTDGQPWSGGTFEVFFVPGQSSPGPPLWGGVPFAPSIFSGVLSVVDSPGFGTVDLPSNTDIFPAGSRWKFNICPNASSVCGEVDLPVTGVTQDASSILSAGVPVVRFPAIPGAFGYADSEVTPTPNPGGMYFNVTDGSFHFWTGSAWQVLGA